MESFIRHSYAFKIMVNYKHLTLKYFLPYSTYLMLVFLLLKQKNNNNNCRGFQRWLVGKQTCCLSIRASAKILGSHIKSLHSGICRHIRSDRVKGNWEGRMKHCATWCWSAHFPEFTSPMETDVSRSSSVTLFLQPKGNYCQHPETKGKKSREGLAEALKADSTARQ